jgi:hypothetical protein
MRSLTGIGTAMLALALVTGCGSESGPTGENAPSFAAASHPDSTAHRTFVELLDEVLPSPCNGELIHYTGMARTQMTFVASPDTLFQHAVLHIVVKETGIGLTTGAIYTAKDNIYEGFTLPYGHLQFQSFRFHEKFRITTPTPGLSFGAHFQVHFVGVPDGDGKFTKTVGAEECFT